MSMSIEEKINKHKIYKKTNGLASMVQRLKVKMNENKDIEIEPPTQATQATQATQTHSTQATQTEEIEEEEIKEIEEKVIVNLSQPTDANSDSIASFIKNTEKLSKKITRDNHYVRARVIIKLLCGFNFN